MISDTFFSLSRFVSVCRKEMVENWKPYVLRSVMVYGVLAILFIWNGYYTYKFAGSYSAGETDPMWVFESVLFLCGLFAWGCISASFTMERMKTKTSRLVVLMTPATMFEKFFSRWLLATFGFLVVYLIAFKMADWTRVAVYTVAYPQLDIVSSFPLWEFCTNTGSFYDASVENGQALMFISGYFFAQSFFLLGSVVWPKNALVKTFAAGICIVIVYVLVAIACIKAVVPHDLNISGGDISEVAARNTVITINFIFVFFNWVLAYFRFKESEIINRW
ncbi:hypothetical protein AAE250_16115 [Bacteroides sp. GD17]|jgi:hypothetical protein|uniref:hypothetical protein n=1 Tax=Bacteroides sp. GD17 TaxID=3139826 RepID=UPI0025F2316B|nr:hypothetical protein [uncultured Bacteroides sp.]